MGRMPQSFTTSIAVLDDDVRYIRMVERVLADEGIGVLPITTLDQGEAVSILAAGPCRIALIDIMMYGQAAGFDLVRQIRETPATAALRLIVASGAEREIGRNSEFLREHDCSVLLKPFAPDDLIARVRLALRSALLPEPVPAAPAPDGRLMMPVRAELST